MAGGVIHRGAGRGPGACIDRDTGLPPPCQWPSGAAPTTESVAVEAICWAARAKGFRASESIH